MIEHGKLNVIIDLQWGSTGKGKLGAWIGGNHDLSAVTCDFQPNAGHTVVLDDGRKVVLHQIPAAAAVNDDCVILVNPASSIDVDGLIRECEELGCWGRVFIHPHANIVLPEHKRREEELSRISSTKQGAGAALADKVMRRALLAKDIPDLSERIADTCQLLNRLLAQKAPCLAETAQGFDLSLNFGQYPHVTSRDITTAAALSNNGVSPRMCGHVFGSCRMHPIRVGNMLGSGDGEDGWSGPCHPDQREISWEELGVEPEVTTVTKKVRRVFTWSNKQIVRAVVANGVTRLFLNFVNYVDKDATGKRAWAELPQGARDVVNNTESLVTPYGATVSLLGTGPKQSDMVRL